MYIIFPQEQIKAWIDQDPNKVVHRMITSISSLGAPIEDLGNGQVVVGKGVEHFQDPEGNFHWRWPDPVEETPLQKAAKFASAGLVMVERHKCERGNSKLSEEPYCHICRAKITSLN